MYAQLTNAKLGQAAALIDLCTKEDRVNLLERELLAAIHDCEVLKLASANASSLLTACDFEGKMQPCSVSWHSVLCKRGTRSIC